MKMLPDPVHREVMSGLVSAESSPGKGTLADSKKVNCLH